jgi:hypothetical protein
MEDLLTLEEVAKALGTSERNVKALKAQRKLTGIKVRRAGLPPEHRYQQSEVEALQTERLQRMTKVLPAGSAIQMPAPHGGALVRAEPQALTVVRDAQVEPEAPPARSVEPVPVSWEWMTIEQAMIYRGFGREFIEKHVQGYGAGPHGKLLYYRDDLDQLDPRKVLKIDRPAQKKVVRKRRTRR